MDTSGKRTEWQALDAVAAGNRRWWNGHTMSYDWNDTVPGEKFSPGWYDEIDRRFIEAAGLFAHDRVPFDRIIPFETLRTAPSSRSAAAWVCTAN